MKRLYEIINHFKPDFLKSEYKITQEYLSRSLKKYNLGYDLQDPIISRKLLNIKDEFKPYINEIQYRN